MELQTVYGSVDVADRLEVASRRSGEPNQGQGEPNDFIVVSHSRSETVRQTGEEGVWTHGLDQLLTVPGPRQRLDACPEVAGDELMAEAYAEYRDRDQVENLRVNPNRCQMVGLIDVNITSGQNDPRVLPQRRRRHR